MKMKVTLKTNATAATPHTTNQLIIIIVAIPIHLANEMNDKTELFLVVCCCYLFFYFYVVLKDKSYWTYTNSPLFCHMSRTKGTIALYNIYKTGVVLLKNFFDFF